MKTKEERREAPPERIILAVGHKSGEAIWYDDGRPVPVADQFNPIEYVRADRYAAALESLREHMLLAKQLERERDEAREALEYRESQDEAMRVLLQERDEARRRNNHEDLPGQRTAAGDPDAGAG